MNCPLESDALLPWLRPHWARLWQAHRAERFGHAWLVTGPAGLGKRMLVARCAHALLCAQPDAQGTPCGVCAECRLLRGGHHPDLIRVEPDPAAASGEIKIDAVRALIERDTLTPHRGVRKIVCIAPAEVLNRAAANALLKTLEEPAATTRLLLVAEELHRLPATILSRCQRLTIPAPDETQALPWLAAQLGADRPAALLLRLAHGAPLRALALARSDALAARDRCFDDLLAVARGQRDPLTAANAWQALEHGLVLDWLAGWVCDLARLGGDPEAAFLDHPDHRATLAALARCLDARVVQHYFRELLHARRLLDSTVNKPLLFEALAIRWALLVEGARACLNPRKNVSAS